MVEKCFICGGSKGKLTSSCRVTALRSGSEKREDNLCQGLENNATSFRCHRQCVNSYCSPDHIARAVKKRKSEEAATPCTSSKRLRSEREQAFNFLEHCLFCGETCNVQRSVRNPTRWRAAYLRRTMDRSGKTSFKHSILRKAEQRGDKWGNEVAFRTNSAVSDLHAADARYHKDCMSKFFSNDPGRSCDKMEDDAFNKLIEEMKGNRSQIWNIIEIHQLYEHLGGTLLSRRILLRELENTLYPDLVILTSPGISSIIAFKNNATKQLRLVDDVDNDNSRPISCLAKNIKQECLQHKPNPDVYQTYVSMGSVIGQCSETLLALLGEISPQLDSSLPAAMIGHIILSAVCNQPTTLQISLGVLLDQQRTALDNLHQYGVVCSYNELRRFRISAAANMAKDDNNIGKFDPNNGLIQIVADNFDAQISSQNGQKSTHGLAMVITQAGHTDEDVSSIKRLKWEDTNASKLSLGEVEVQRYSGSKKTDMPVEQSKKVVPKLSFLAKMQVSLNRANDIDIKFLNDITKDVPCAEYSGFNTERARESGEELKPKTSLVYTPYLDMPPAEPDTMKTAMMYAQSKMTAIGQKFTIFTCDQQLYQVMVNVIWADQDLFPNFIPRLGGMHMLMSFVGCVGTLMGGSGLEDVLKKTFAGAPKMLSGKKYPQNVRGLRMLVEELLRPLLQDIHTMADLLKVIHEAGEKSRTTKLWVDCVIKPILIMMLFIRAEREGDWALHLVAVQKMIPYFFAAGHVNYARYGLNYLRSMYRLQPNIQEKFTDGEHVMRHQDGIWNGIWSDMFIETTYMRYGKGPSGIIGSTLNDTTLAIWALSHSTFTQVKRDVHAMTDGTAEKTMTSHKEERHTRKKRRCGR